MRKFWLYSIVFCLCLPLCAHQQDLLKLGDINQIMGQILIQHVDKKAMTDKIVQSSLAIFIDQFDPQRIYLLDSEVEPYLNMTPEKLTEILNQYKEGNFSAYVQLNKAIQGSIERSRRIRKELDDLAKNKQLSNRMEKGTALSSSPDEIIPFAQTVDQLKERLKRQEELYLEAYRRRFGEAMSAQQKERVLQNYEEKMRDFENQYLYQNDRGEALPPLEQENLFVIHVLKSLASSLDSHTSFYQANEAYAMRVRLQKEFKGIGAVLKDTDQGVIVSHLLEGGPAAQNGEIKVGDTLLEIDGESIVNEPFEKVMEKLHGEKNLNVKLRLRHLGESDHPGTSYTVDLIRKEIILNNDRVDVSAEPFGNGIIGKITLHSFYQGDGISSEEDVRHAIEKLEQQGNLRGLILDLRSNSGGFLAQAVQVAGLFITKGVIVISKYANGDERFYRDVDGTEVYDGPLIVLTSKATASAAEIVTQALQDYGVALVVGDEHTYGKGTIQTQTVTDNQSTSYFKVTVGKYYTVSGHTPQKEGVKADVVAPGHWSKEEIGEIYMDSVEPDTIPPTFEDKLTDVSPEAKAWYLKYYMPNLQKRTNKWRNLLPTLQKNSQYRIAHNKNYQFFLKGGKPEEEEKKDEEDEWEEPSKKGKSYGEDDLQMQEAVNVLKDMIMLQGAAKPSANTEAPKSP